MKPNIQFNVRINVKHLEQSFHYKKPRISRETPSPRKAQKNTYPNRIFPYLALIPTPLSERKRNNRYSPPINTRKQPLYPSQANPTIILPSLIPMFEENRCVHIIIHTLIKHKRGARTSIFNTRSSRSRTQNTDRQGWKEIGRGIALMVMVD